MLAGSECALIIISSSSIVIITTHKCGCGNAFSHICLHVCPVCALTFESLIFGNEVQWYISSTSRSSSCSHGQDHTSVTTYTLAVGWPLTDRQSTISPQQIRRQTYLVHFGTWVRAASPRKNCPDLSWTWHCRAPNSAVLGEHFASTTAYQHQLSDLLLETFTTHTTTEKWATEIFFQLRIHLAVSDFI